MSAIDLAAVNEVLAEIRRDNAARALKAPKPEEKLQMRANIFVARLMEELDGRYGLNSMDMCAILDKLEGSSYFKNDFFKLCCAVLRKRFPAVKDVEKASVDSERISRITNHVYGLIEMVFPLFPKSDDDGDDGELTF